MTDVAKCQSVLNIKGQHYGCDLNTNHKGLAHSSRAAEAIWLSEDEKEWHHLVEWVASD